MTESIPEDTTGDAVDNGTLLFLQVLRDMHPSERLSAYADETGRDIDRRRRRAGFRRAEDEPGYQPQR